MPNPDHTDDLLPDPFADYYNGSDDPFADFTDDDFDGERLPDCDKLK